LLQRAGLIRYARGHTVLDRKAWKNAVVSVIQCQWLKKEYDRLLPDKLAR